MGYKGLTSVVRLKSFDWAELQKLAVTFNVELLSNDITLNVPYVPTHKSEL